MTLHKIIDKICKCLRLAESANPNEAAAALRQAVGLMQKYDVSEELVDAHELHVNQMTETSVKSSGASKPAYWVLALSNLVAEAFDCRVYISRKKESKPEFIFIGVDNRPEVASYLYTILYRSLGRARVNFMKEIVPRKTLDTSGDLVKEKRRRANIFAQAWIFRVSNKIELFKNNKKIKKVNKPVDDYVHLKYGLASEYKQDAVDVNAPDYDDILIGMRAAEDVSLYRPLRQTQNNLQITSAN